MEVTTFLLLVLFLGKAILMTYIVRELGLFFNDELTFYVQFSQTVDEVSWVVNSYTGLSRLGNLRLC